MKLANPLHYPLAVLAGAVVLVAGVRLAKMPFPIALPVATGMTLGGAVLLKAREPEVPILENPELEQELQSARQQARVVAEKAIALRQEATRLLTDTLQVDVLASVQYTCDRAGELPQKIDALAQRLRGTDSLLEVDDLQRQLTAVDYKLRTSSGVVQEQLQRLAESLRRNIQLAQQGQDTRQAQIASLSTLILDCTGVLQSMQNQIRTIDFTDATQMADFRALSDELNRFQENVDLLLR
jgi:uncharacterized membrane protein